MYGMYIINTMDVNNVTMNEWDRAYVLCPAYRHGKVEVRLSGALGAGHENDFFLLSPAYIYLGL